MADLVTLTIDGQKTQAPKGSLVIEAASLIGVDVPRFCYHPKLSAVGMCRMCLGEVGMPKMNSDKTPALNDDGTPAVAMMPKPQTLCTMQAAEGMVVLTDTPAVVKMREGVLEFFLANHPLDCPVCDKGGECMLQDQSMLYANGMSRVQDMYSLRKDMEKDYPLSPLIALDRERCIQCARCTRFQDEVAHDHVLQLVARGSRTMIDTMSDPPFDSHFSGNTIDLCPVGALTSREFRFRARVWELKNIPTISMIDGSGTNIFVGQRNETLDRIIPRDNESINECWISDRDRFGLQYIDNDARLTFPLVRRDGKLAPATWDEALQLVADKMKAASTRTAALGSGKLTNEGALAMASLFKEAVGTPHLDCELSPTISTPGAPPADFYEEIEAADAILIVGSNPNEELPMLDLRLKKAASQKKTKIINCNAYKTPLDALATHSLLMNEKSEVALLNGLARLIHASWNDEPAQSESLHRISGGEGANAWIDSLAPYASTRVAEIAGIDEAELRAAATAITESERLILLVGANASPQTLEALRNIAALKSRDDFVVALHGEANAVGVRRAGVTPGENGFYGARVLAEAAAGNIDVLYLAAQNPLRQAQSYEVAKRALEKTPFVVVQTLFLNEVTEYADVVLPAASFLEQDGTTTNFHGRVQSLKAAFRPRERRDEDGSTLSACAPDWVIFTKLQQLLGKDSGARQVADLTDKLAHFSGAENATPRFQSVNHEAENAQLSDGQLRLISGPLLMDGGESFRYSNRLHQVVPEPFVAINRSDARKMGIEHNAIVEVKTTRGTVQVRAKVGRAVKAGTAWLPQLLRDVQFNALRETDAPFTAATLTKIADAPPLQLTSVMDDAHPPQADGVSPDGATKEMQAALEPASRGLDS